MPDGRLSYTLNVWCVQRKKLDSKKLIWKGFVDAFRISAMCESMVCIHAFLFWMFLQTWTIWIFKRCGNFYVSSIIYRSANNPVRTVHRWWQTSANQSAWYDDSSDCAVVHEQDNYIWHLWAIRCHSSRNTSLETDSDVINQRVLSRQTPLKIVFCFSWKTLKSLACACAGSSNA